MKRFTIITLASIFAFTAMAQPEPKAPAKAPAKEEQKAPTLNNLRDPEKAMDLAKKEKKIVMYHFTGSTWCPPCKQLDAKVIHSKEFIDFANKNLAYVNMDNNRRGFVDKEYNEKYMELMAKYKVTGFPTLIFINPKNNEVKKMVGYSGKATSEIIKEIEAFKK